MDIPQELIQRFLNKQCTTEEAEQVALYLKNNPQVLDKFIGKADWDEHDNQPEKPQEFWDEVWEQIKPVHQTRKKTLWLRYIAAACVLLVCGLFFLQKTNQENIAKTPVLAHQQHRILQNNKTVPWVETLEDGSTIILQPHAKISFKQPFTNGKRLITLTGEAVFKVAKDKNRPFIVVSGDVLTTALGTKFKVSSLPDQKTIKVHLYEGSVKVEPSIKQGNWATKILKPGDELTYDKIRLYAFINRSQHKTAKKLKTKNPQELVFKNEPLATVFEKLAIRYQTPIRYNDNDISRLYFIGTFEEKDSLSIILSKISKLNNLKITADAAGGYQISK